MESPPNKVPAGERPREYRFSNMVVSEEDFILRFDENYALSVKSKAVLGNQSGDGLVELKREPATDELSGNECSVLKLDFDLFFHQEGKLISQLDCHLDNEPDSQTIKQIVSEFHGGLPLGKLVDIGLKFRHVEGLGLKPLRDYQISSPATDVILAVEDKRFHVNKADLASESSHFEVLFGIPSTKTYRSDADLSIDIYDMDVGAETMTALLDVLGGHFYWPPSKDALTDVLTAAAKFQLTKVTKKIEDNLIKIDKYGSLNEMDKRELANRFGMDALKATLPPLQPGRYRGLVATWAQMNGEDEVRSRTSLFLPVKAVFMESPPNRVPAGERPRVARFQHVPVNNVKDLFVLQFDEHLFLSVRAEALQRNPKPYLLFDLYRKTKTDPVSILQCRLCEWKLEFEIFFYLKGKLISQLECRMDSSSYIQAKQLLALRNRVSRIKFVDIEIKFRHIGGLGIKPLRDYQIATPATDVALAVDGQKFHVNKGILATESPFFEAMFYGSFVEKDQSEVAIEEISAETMTGLLDLVDGQFYWPPSKDALFDLLNAADRFLLTSVTKKIEDFVINIDDYGLLDLHEKMDLPHKYNMNVLRIVMGPRNAEEMLQSFVGSASQEMNHVFRQLLRF